MEHPSQKDVSVNFDAFGDSIFNEFSLYSSERFIRSVFTILRTIASTHVKEGQDEGTFMDADFCELESHIRAYRANKGCGYELPER